jgi:hypothetical protein
MSTSSMPLTPRHGDALAPSEPNDLGHAIEGPVILAGSRRVSSCWQEAFPRVHSVWRRTGSKTCIQKVACAWRTPNIRQCRVYSSMNPRSTSAKGGHERAKLIYCQAYQVSDIYRVPGTMVMPSHRLCLRSWILQHTTNRDESSSPA